MRRLVYVEGPDGAFAWATPDDELHRHFAERAAFMTTHLYGRRMWETISVYWPDALDDPDAIAREFGRRRAATNAARSTGSPSILKNQKE